MTILDVSAFTRRLTTALLLVTALLGLASVPAAAQVADGVIEVVAQDESKAVLPGVTVTVLRPDTGFTQTNVTDAAGTARFVGMQPGTYTVKVELSGFATINQEGILLRVGQTARLTMTMKVGQVAETVNVVAEAPLVDVFRTDSSTNIIPEQIESLPVANRDFQSLAFLAPGVQRERGGNRFIGNQPVIGAAGNASQSTIMVDGVDFTDPTLGLARARFSQDAISEFRVIANRFDTEIGGSSGGALSIVTKSGTNDLHGSAFGFFRDNSLRAKGEFDLKKNDYSRQQFGGTIGGPIAKDRDALLRVVRAGQREQLRALPARRRLRLQGGGPEGALRPVAVLRRARHADARRAEPAVQVRVRAVPPGELPRRRASSTRPPA